MSESSSSHIHMNRRTMLQYGAGVGVAAAGLGVVQRTDRAAAADPDMTLVLDRRAFGLTGGTQPDQTSAVQAAQQRRVDECRLLMSLYQATGRTVFSDQNLDIAAGSTRTTTLGNSMTRLESMAVSWATPDLAGITGNTELRTMILDILNRIHVNFYRRDGERTGNWFVWEIKGPATLINTMILLRGHVPPALQTAILDATRYYSPNPNRRGPNTSLRESGANRAEKARICYLRGALDGLASDIILGRDAFSDVQGGGALSLFKYVTSGDGFYADGSFIQHGKIPYFGEYGKGAVASVASGLSDLRGTPWEITDPGVSVVVDAVERSIVPFVFNGRMMDLLRGRAVSRHQTPDSLDGARAAAAVMELATGTSDTVRRGIQSHVKSWISSCSDDYFALLNLPDIARAAAIMNDDSVPTAPVPIGHFRTGSQERSVHRRPGWTFAVATSSTRIGRYEWGNGNNGKGFYQGDGFTFLNLDSAQNHYADDFWPTVNIYRHSGVVNTDVERPADFQTGGIPGASNLFSGGVDHDGLGIVSQDLRNFDGTLSACQSWFFLDDRVVALVGGVNSSGGFPVFANIEQRNIGTRNELATFSGGSITSPTTLTGPTWAHLTSVGGYVVHSNSSLNAKVAAQSGRWSDIDQTGPTDIRTRNYFTLTAPLGVNVVNGSVAYSVMPLASVERVKAIAAKIDFAILANTRDVQSIRYRRSPNSIVTTCATFYRAAATNGLKSSGPCSVIVAQQGTTLDVSITDPSRQATNVTIDIDGVFVARTVSQSAPVTVTRTTTGTSLTMDLRGTFSKTLRFRGATA